MRYVKLFPVLILLSINFPGFSQVQPEWMIFNSSNSPLPVNLVTSIAIDTFNNKWIAAGGQLIKISGDDFTDFSNWAVIQGLPFNVSFIQTDKDGKVWMGSGQNQASGLASYDGNSFTIYNTQNSQLPYDYVSGIAVDMDNNIWIMDGIKDVTSQIYLVELDHNNNWFQFPGNFGYQTVGDLAGVDSADNIWTASEFKLTRVNTITHVVTEWNENGLGQYVTQVKPDYKGNVWIAGAEAGWGGLVKFDGQDFTHLSISAISLAVDDQKNLWVGTEALLQDTLKILKYDGVNWTELTPYNSELPDDFGVHELEFDRRGNLWIATTDSGMAVYKPGGLVIPVELDAFSAAVAGTSVRINWSTSTETNNKGFEIQRSLEELPASGTGRSSRSKWESRGFVGGNGTTTSEHSYSYRDKNLTPGNYYYRLKQIDFDGSYEFSQEVEVRVSAPKEFSLEQNYPNPFNPATTIKYTIPSFRDGEKIPVTLKVYDMLGKEIKVLVNTAQSPGEYIIRFDGKNFASGIYLYSLRYGDYSAVRKMILLK